MWEWLLWGHTPKPRPKQLGDVLERLLAAGAGDGESAFTLPEKELKRLCSAARDALLKEPTLLDISTAGNVVVVGDLHGQFGDLQRIFQRLGRPGSDDKVWIFLGDYIDRGPMGLEIVATLLALKLRHPNSIYLLRGNHECSEITVLFGFCGECQRRSTLAVWEAVMQVFDALPLAALLNNKVFLCHGGISPYLHRPQDVNAIRRPLDVNPNGEGLLADLLWADPSGHISGWCANPRGVSFVFGLDVAQQWLRQQGLRAIVRAHMVQQNGFEVLGNNEVMTVFSATDYRDSGNTGAVLLIAPTLEFEFVCFPPTARPDGAVAPQAAAGAAAGQPAEQEQFSSPQPAAPLPDNAGVSLPVGPLAASPFAADADVPLRAAAPVAGVEASPAAQTMQQEAEEEREVISNQDLANLARKGSAGLEQLEQLTGGSRVPAVALLARKSAGACTAAAGSGSSPPAD
jgi:serine/threonine-protein phosphatase PP1 catalytic subunit